MKAARYKIGIVDDHALFRQGISALLKEYDELEIIFQAGNGQIMQDAIRKCGVPDVVLMDIHMPVMDGYESTDWLKTNYPGVVILALSMYEDDQSVIKMIRKGAGGYVLKESNPAELLEAILTVKARGVYLNELLSGKMFRSLSKPAEHPLSPKEFEFIQLCCSEMTYKEIADKMSISPRTVDNYRESLFLKLHVKSRVGLVLYAIQNQLFQFHEKK